MKTVKDRIAAVLTPYLLPCTTWIDIERVVDELLMATRLERRREAIEDLQEQVSRQAQTIERMTDERDQLADEVDDLRHCLRQTIEDTDKKVAEQRLGDQIAIDKFKEGEIAADRQIDRLRRHNKRLDQDKRDLRFKVENLIEKFQEGLQ